MTQSYTVSDEQIRQLLSAGQPTTTKQKPEKRKGLFRKAVEDDLHEVEGKKEESLKYFDKVKLNLFPTKTFLITMFFSNGTCKQFVIYTKKKTFIYKGRSYYLYK